MLQQELLPVEWLREINLVDTPGTNAVIQGHQEITEHFVPRSDLVLFVTSADRQFSEPRRCPACRAVRKAQRGESSGGGYSDGGGYGGGGGGAGWDEGNGEAREGKEGGVFRFVQICTARAWPRLVEPLGCLTAISTAILHGSDEVGR